jgi:oligopeptide/dipeptide ABC transporter ATP-binding protein
MNTLLNVSHLKKFYQKNEGLFSFHKEKVHAVDDVSFSLKEGETIGIVGESGCGKSTLGKAILRLFEIDGGHIYFENKDIALLPAKDLREIRKDMQMIFQDPYGSLNPRMTIYEILKEPFSIHKLSLRKEEIEKKIKDLIKEVGLNEDALSKFPHEFSGGQKQRISIARALALRPKLIICDEPVSALDVSIQAQILNLMKGLQDKYKLSFVFISHNLAVVEYISHTIAVMYLGRLVEIGHTKDIFQRPFHPYTASLLRSIPNHRHLEKRYQETIKGELPNPLNPPSGCHFHTRCPFAQDICKTQTPVLRSLESKDPDHKVACHFSETLLDELKQV